MNMKRLKYIYKKQYELDKMMEQIATSIGYSNGVVTDGIFSPKNYLEANVKIMFLLREPHDDGGWAGREAIRDKFESYRKREGENTGWKTYFDLMSYVLYSVQNGYLSWDDCPDAEIDINIRKLILSIAFVNCSKIPGGATINKKLWWERVDRFWPVVSKQITLAAPDVIICMGTNNFLEKQNFLVDCEAKGKIGETDRYYYKNKISRQLILDWYHPIQRRLSRQKYFDNIIEVLKKEKIALKM